MGLGPEARSERARTAVLTRHSRTNGADATAAARAAVLARYKERVDPDGTLSEEERERRAKCAIGADLARVRMRAARERDEAAAHQQIDELIAMGGGL